MSEEEMTYLKNLSERIGRKLTDSEVFGFSQVNSEHCRHKIFNGLFIVDGEEMPSTLFGLIKRLPRSIRAVWYRLTKITVHSCRVLWWSSLRRHHMKQPIIIQSRILRV